MMTNKVLHPVLLALAGITVSGCGFYDSQYEELAESLVGIWEGETEQSHAWCFEYNADGSMQHRTVLNLTPAGVDAETKLKWDHFIGVYEVVKGKRLIHRTNLAASSVAGVSTENAVKETKLEQQKHETADDNSAAQKNDQNTVYNHQSAHVLQNVDAEIMNYVSMDGKDSYVAKRVEACSAKFEVVEQSQVAAE